MTDRYTDKPFLRFVDAYVLKAIGHLDDATEAYCKAMVPSLEKSFGLKGGWSDIVAQRMKFAPELPEQIRKIWDEGRLRFAQANGQPADPVQFTYLFVDKNLQSVCLFRHCAREGAGEKRADACPKAKAVRLLLA